jgi:hypothetical protein
VAECGREKKTCRVRCIGQCRFSSSICTCTKGLLVNNACPIRCIVISSRSNHTAVWHVHN